MLTISQKCKKLLLEENINSDSNIDFDVNGKIHSMDFEYIIDTYMQASEDSQEVFLLALKKSIDAKEMGVDKFFEGMGQLLLMTHLSSKIEV
ncbi:hypothetical protein [Sulfurimonas sp.]|uniref:hypothetical protein n=1 Tax=Sulfurimonas sp. TaxID=2022749 RepID=UPI002AB1C2C4|nr:hypothetical protein [Sulfurimonas sp.]